MSTAAPVAVDSRYSPSASPHLAVSLGFLRLRDSSGCGGAGGVNDHRELIIMTSWSQGKAPSRDRGNRRADQRALAGLLPRVQQRDPPDLDDQPGDNRRTPQRAPSLSASLNRTTPAGSPRIGARPGDRLSVRSTVLVGFGNDEHAPHASRPQSARCARSATGRPRLPEVLRLGAHDLEHVGDLPPRRLAAVSVRRNRSGTAGRYTSGAGGHRRRRPTDGETRRSSWTGQRARQCAPDCLTPSRRSSRSSSMVAYAGRSEPARGRLAM